MILSFYDADGLIRLVNDYPDDITAPEIAALTPAGGGYYVGRSSPKTQWFDTGVLSDRPSLGTQPEYRIAADGIDAIVIPVPSGTEIVCNTIAGPSTITAGEDFEWTRNVPAADQFVLLPPFPYISASFWIFSAFVASKSYASVKTDDIARDAVKPTQLVTMPLLNQVRDYNMEDKILWAFKRYVLAAGVGTIALVADADVTVQDNPSTSSGFGTSVYRFQIVATSMTDVIVVESEMMPVKRGQRYLMSAWAKNYNAADMDKIKLEVDCYKVDADGLAVFSQVRTVEETTGLTTSTTAHYQSGLVNVGSETSYVVMRLIMTPKSTNAVNLPSAQVSSFVLEEYISAGEINGFYDLYALNPTTVTFGSSVTELARTGDNDFSVDNYGPQSFYACLFSFRLRNAAAASKTYAFYITAFINGGETEIYRYSNYLMRQDDVIGVAGMTNTNPFGKGRPTRFLLYADPAQNGNDLRQIDFKVSPFRI